MATFSASDRGPCPARGLCTTGRRRQLSLPPRDLAEAQAAARAAETTLPFQAGYARRAGVEGAMHQATSHGARRARYRGLPKTRLDHAYMAAALNLLRLEAYWTARHWTGGELATWHASNSAWSHGQGLTTRIGTWRKTRRQGSACPGQSLQVGRPEQHPPADPHRPDGPVSDPAFQGAPRDPQAPRGPADVEQIQVSHGRLTRLGKQLVCQPQRLSRRSLAVALQHIPIPPDRDRDEGPAPVVQGDDDHGRSPTSNAATASPDSVC